MLPSISRENFQVPNRLVDLQPTSERNLMIAEGKTLVIGDSHAGTGNLFMYAAKRGLITILPEVAERLDCIAQSSLIDQLEEAWQELEKIESTMMKSPSLFQINKKKTAEAQYNYIKSLVMAEKDEFDSLLSRITKNPTDKEIKGVGDDVADRNYNDLYAIKAGILINLGKIMSNHGAELLDAWVNNKWELKDTYYLFPDHTHSLWAFKVMLKHRIISETERDELLKAWASTLDIMWYSRLDSEDKRESHVSFYMHAPGRIWRIFQLAKMYKISSPRTSEEINNIRLDDICKIVSQIMDKFKDSLEKFCSEKSDLIEEGRKELAGFLEKGRTQESAANNLMNMRCDEYLEFEMRRDNKLLLNIHKNEAAAGNKVLINWVYGHTTPLESMPKDMSGIDSNYWKPFDPNLFSPEITVDTSNRGELVSKKFEELNDNMEDNLVYYTMSADSSHLIFKVKVTQSALAQPIYDKWNNLSGYEHWKNGHCHQPHYFSGVVSCPEVIEDLEKSICEAIPKRKQALLEEYDPDMYRKEPLREVPVVTTSQHFPQRHFGKYALLGTEKIAESLSRYLALPDKQADVNEHNLANLRMS